MKSNKIANLISSILFLILLFRQANIATATDQSIILYNVPFTSQAPLARWNDPKQQDGCEEASALMAVAWARHKSFAPKQAEKEIIAIANFELKKYGGYQDTSAEDTVKRIFKSYFNYNNATTTAIRSTHDIIEELKRGNLVIAPVNGQKLKNPNYKRPGPERHMLLIKGYDFTKQEFITNDSGTRKGNNYRYKIDVLENAIRDYLTGDKKPIKEIKKNIIIIKPE